MKKFIDIPHLPKGRVSALIAGECYAGILEKPLKALGAQYIPMPDCDCVGDGLRGHADLCIAHLGGREFVVARNMRNKFQKLIYFLTENGAVIYESERTLGAKYPQDVPLNVCILDETVVCNTKYADPIILNSVHKLIHVSQGYTKCSICVVDERSIITSDKNITSQLRENGYNVLEISAGHIALPGYDSGFIGGAAFKLSRNILAFSGSLDSHPDKNAILDFLSNRGISPAFLTDMEIFDIGSVIPIVEDL